MKRIFPLLSLLAMMVACEMDAPTPPDAKFTVENAGCTAPCTVTFYSNTENATSFEWDFDDGSPIEKGTKVSHEYKAGKNFLVKLVVKNNAGLSDGLTQAVKVNAAAASKPVAKFEVTLDKSTPPAKATFINRSTNSETYKWQFGDPDSGSQNESTDQVPTHTYTKAQKYTISLVAYNKEGEASAPFTLTVELKNEAPTADFSIDNNNCEAPCTVSFNATSTGATSYLWDFGGDGSSDQKSPKHTFTKSGTYAVKLIAKGPGGEFPVTKTVTIRAKAPNAIAITGTYNFPTQMVADASGNIYICGTMAGTADFGNGKVLSTSDSRDNSDYFLAKYNPSGECLWAYTDGSAGLDQANGLTLDDAGNVYITGIMGGSPRKASGYTGGFVAKFTGNGSRQWFQSFGGKEGTAGKSVAFYRTNQGPKVYVAGTAKGTAGNRDIQFGNGLVSADAQDIFLVFYDAETGAVGTPLVVGGPNSQSLSKMVVDQEGSAYLTGSFDGVMSFSGAQGRLSGEGRMDVFLAKWNLRDGDWSWAVNLGSSDDDYGYDVAVNEQNDLAITASFTRSGVLATYVVMWNSNGDPKWHYLFAPNGEQKAGGIAITPTGNVVLAATFNVNGTLGHTLFDTDGGYDVLIAEMNGGNGSVDGRLEARGGGTREDQSIEVCVAPDGTVYNTGWFSGTATFNGTELKGGRDLNTYIVRYKY